MVPGKSYGQFCALARGLDRVGDRWTLLVVRELLLGPRSFRDLQAGLEGIGSSVLVDRLRRLEGDGIVQRNDAPRRSKAVRYALTPLGEGLAPAVLALIRWGARWMFSGPGDDVVEPRWAVLALRALLQGPVAGGRSGRVHVEVAGAHLGVDTAAGRRTVTAGAPDDVAARVSGSFADLLAVAAGVRRLPETGAVVEGDLRAAETALAPAGEIPW